MLTIKDRVIFSKVEVKFRGFRGPPKGEVRLPLGPRSIMGLGAWGATPTLGLLSCESFIRYST